MEIQTAPAGVPAEQQIGGGRGHVLERRVVVVAAQICKRFANCVRRRYLGTRRPK